ncbi:MAG: hypothetical protein LBH37_01680 [Oscillospiraceae bacterium]|jgi:hypothetical protein|nr:hypothetical protein [Oscillospiraceae bacterium]
MIDNNSKRKMITKWSKLAAKSTICACLSAATIVSSPVCNFSRAPVVASAVWELLDGGKLLWRGKDLPGAGVWCFSPGEERTSDLEVTRLTILAGQKFSVKKKNISQVRSGLDLHWKGKQKDLQEHWLVDKRGGAVRLTQDEWTAFVRERAEMSKQIPENIKKEREDHQLEIKKLNNQLDALRQELQDANGEIANLNSQIEKQGGGGDLEVENKNLRDQLEQQAVAQLEAISDKINFYKNQATELQKEKELLEKGNERHTNDLKIMNSDMQNEILLFNEKLGKLQQELGKLQQLKKDDDFKLDDFDQENKALKEKLKKIEQQNEVLKGKLSQIKQQATCEGDEPKFVDKESQTDFKLQGVSRGETSEDDNSDEQEFDKNKIEETSLQEEFNNKKGQNGDGDQGDGVVRNEYDKFWEHLYDVFSLTDRKFCEGPTKIEIEVTANRSNS